MTFTALIIDADGKTPATLKNLLAPYGFEFTVTENGPEAVNVARQAAPDIILLRAELPLTTGFSVCNRLRRNDDTRKIPLVLYSSNASDDVIDQHRNLKTHADHYLKLPLDPERLLGAVRNHLTLQAKPAAPAPGARQSGADLGAARNEPSGRRSRLEIELADATPAPKPAEDREFADKFDQSHAPVPTAHAASHSAPQAAAAASRLSGPLARSGEESGSRRLSSPDLAALTDSEASDGGAGGFKAQRETLQLKSQLNQKNREILALKEQLESRERAILDAKKSIRDLQAQAGEFEANLLSAQEQSLSASEAAEVARRDMQTSLKREEGLKTRLEVTQKKLKDTEAELAAARQSAAAAAEQSAATVADLRARLAGQAAAIADLEAERNDLGQRLATAEQSILTLQDELAGEMANLAAARDEIAGLTATLRKTREDDAQALADAAAAHAAAKANLEQAHADAMAAAAEAHRGEMARQDATYRAAAEQMTAEAAEAAEQAQQEHDRLSQALLDAEENARLQISQLTQTLAATEETARAEIQRLTAALAAAEESARSEIQRLTAAAQEAADKAAAEAAEQGSRIASALADIDELGVSLDRSETALHRRKEAALAAQQALAVALRLLEDTGDAQ